MRALCRSAAFALALLALAAASATPAAGVSRKPLPGLTPVPRDALTAALGAGRLSEAEYALERARSLFQLGAVRAEFGDVQRPGRHDATLVLRDLALRLRFLSGAERAQAERVLARPDGGGVPIGNGWSSTAVRSTRCSADPIELCFHWVRTTADVATPQFVDQVQSTLENIWTKEISTYGYKAPLSDASSSNDGGGPELDVYLDNLGSVGVFGYCTSDDPNRSNPTVFAVSAYCVLDNDYSAAEFGTRHTPLEFLQVTAAHEFNHASQFAYDWLEDFWLIEGTATNMEETVYPAVDDNLIFLRASQLRHPAWPLDRGGFGDTEYGAWIFWRYVEEKAYGDDPVSIRRVWERADASTPLAPDDYSLKAVRSVLSADGKSFPDEYASFGVANRLRLYQDGAKYRLPPTSEGFVLGPARRSTGPRAWRMGHLTTRYFTFTPGPYASRTARLRVAVDLTRHGSRATVISRYTSAPTEVRAIPLNVDADGGLIVPFGRRTVKRVDLVLSNGSSRTRCWSDLEDPPFYSCFGVPRDDGRLYTFRAIVQ